MTLRILLSRILIKRNIIILAAIIVTLLGFTVVDYILAPKVSIASTQAVSVQVDASANDVTEDTSYSETLSPIYIGNSGTTTPSFTGLRFTNVTIPPGAQITSATLSVYSTQSQWIGYTVSIAGEAVGNSPAFSSSNLPSQRSLTSPAVVYSSDVPWAANTWYNLPDISSVIQPIINLPGWSSGNAISIIIQGSGSSSWGRKFIQSFDGSPAYAAKLSIVYSTSGLTPPPSPTSTATSTPLPSSTATATALLSPTASSTPLSSSTPAPTATSTPNTLFSPTPTQTPQPAGGITTFAINPGGSDIIPHQLVRTAADRLYFFGYTGDLSSTLKAYWTPNAGLPGAAADFGGQNTYNYPAVIISVSPAYDGGNLIHLLINSNDGILRDIPFDISKNTFLAAKILDRGLTVTNTNVGTSGVSAAIDQTGFLDVTYWSGSNHIVFRKYSYSPSKDALSLVDGPTQVDNAGSANHPDLAVSPLDNSITVAWVSQASNPAQILTRVEVQGAWGPILSASTAPAWTSTNGGINIDQGPGLVIDAKGSKYLTYIEDYRVVAPYDYGRVHFVINSGSGWNDSYTGFYSHDPAPAIDSTGNIYFIGHGYPLNPAPCNTMDDMCLYTHNSDGTWGAPKVIAAPASGNSYDSSPSTKWSAVGYNRPDTVEIVFPEVIGGNYSNTVIHYARINPGLASTPTPTQAAGPSSTPTMTPLPASPTSITQTVLTAQISAAGDDVNQDGTTFTPNDTALWLGNGASSTTSFLGLRYEALNIPRNAKIISAVLQVYSVQNQFLTVNVSMAADAVGNSPVFAADNLPSQRTLTASSVILNNNVQWNTNTWYSLPDIASVIQEVVNRSDWSSGNNLSVLIKGTGSAWGRKFINSFEGGAAAAPKLIITYQ